MGLRSTENANLVVIWVSIGVDVGCEVLMQDTLREGAAAGAIALPLECFGSELNFDFHGGWVGWWLVLVVSGLLWVRIWEVPETPLWGQSQFVTNDCWSPRLLLVARPPVGEFFPCIYRGLLKHAIGDIACRVYIESERKHWLYFRCWTQNKCCALALFRQLNRWLWMFSWYWWLVGVGCKRIAYT